MMGTITDPNGDKMRVHVTKLDGEFAHTSCGVFFQDFEGQWLLESDERFTLELDRK